MAESQTATDPYAPPLPKAVRQRAQAADKLHREILGIADSPEEGQPPAPGPAEGGEPPPAINDPPASSPPSQPPGAPPEGAPSDWEHRYRSLQGKYDREIPQMRAQIQSLEGLIATMRTAPPPPQLPPPETVRNINPVIPEEDVQAYGPELVEASRRWARAEVRAELDQLHSEISTLRQGQTRQEAQASTNRLESELSQDPDLGNGVWQRLNHDANYIQWLQEVDPFSGVTRYVMLNHAYQNGDASRTAAFFKAYLREHTDCYRPPPPPPHTYNNGYVPPVDAGQPPRLEDFAAPGRGSATPGGGAPERRIWTNRDITAFYHDRTRGKYRGREEEADRLERDIFAAAVEGRVHN